MLQKFWNYVDRKISETAEDSDDMMDHGYPPLIEVFPLGSNSSYMCEVNMSSMRGCFNFHVYNREVAKLQPNNGITVVIYPNIPQLDFAEEFPKLMQEMGIENWTCDVSLWRIDTLIKNLQLMLSHGTTTA